LLNVGALVSTLGEAQAAKANDRVRATRVRLFGHDSMKIQPPDGFEIHPLLIAMTLV
jgi:hypothetical protein